MHNFITKSLKHLLWKDECGETFLLLKYCEVFRYSESVLRLHVFLSGKASLLRKMGLVLNETVTDDPLHIIDVKIENLDAVIALGAFKRRPNVKGRWIRDKEIRLAHKIILYQPTL